MTTAALSRVGQRVDADRRLLVPGDELDREVDAALREFEACYETRDADRLYRTLEHNLADVERAFPALTREVNRRDQAKMIAIYGSSVPPVIRDPADRDYRLVFGGRLVECIDRDGMPSIRLHCASRGVAVPLPLFLGRPPGSPVLRVLR